MHFHPKNRKGKEKTHGLILVVCQSISQVFLVLGMYNFAKGTAYLPQL